MNRKIFVPSFKLERKTRALNRALWGFVGLISMFTYSFLVVILHLMFSSIWNVEHTWISDHIIFAMLIPMIIFIAMFGTGLYRFFDMLLHSYKFEGDRIIKGKIIRPDKGKITELAADVAVTGYKIKNMDDPSTAVPLGAAVDLYKTHNLIKLNTDEEFVNRFFDTEVYRKTTYDQTKLIKETKYSFIYSSQNNGTLVIPKLYEGMDIHTNSSKECSILIRVVSKSFIIWLLCFIVSMIDLSVGMNDHANYKSNGTIPATSAVCSDIQMHLDAYGYMVKKDCSFEKKDPDDKISVIRYDIDKQGNIKKVDINLYYNKETYNEEELKQIIYLLDEHPSATKIDEFIAQVGACVNGDFSYGKITVGKHTLKIGLSSDYINIYSQY
ncbi:MAG: hypothetical protein HFG16_06290 [Erysipelotrichaceae bacterium]|jgi:hypothetical protein|nr:hypothetical protein [Erysipelotrichaceae bacterium]